MLKKGSKLYSIFFLKCPRCHEGDFLEASPYKLSKFNKVKERCPKCKLKYSIEPSFYYGSMYVSYGVSIVVVIAIYIFTILFGLDLKRRELFAAVVITLVIAMPWIGAVSKLKWANIFFKYEKGIVKNLK